MQNKKIKRESGIIYTVNESRNQITIKLPDDSRLLMKDLQNRAFELVELLESCQEFARLNSLTK